MNIDQAYLEVLMTVGEIRSLGVKVTLCDPLSNAKPSKDRDYLDRTKWVRITFLPDSQEEAKLISQHQSKLLDMGINFDSGGGMGLRDWEIDWSFSVGNVDDNEKDKVTTVNNLLESTFPQEQKTIN